MKDRFFILVIMAFMGFSFSMEQPKKECDKRTLTLLMNNNSTFFAQLPADVKWIIRTKALKQQGYEREQQKFLNHYYPEGKFICKPDVDNDILCSGNPLLHPYIHDLIDKEPHFREYSSFFCAIAQRDLSAIRQNMPKKSSLPLTCSRNNYVNKFNILNIPVALGLLNVVASLCESGIDPNARWCAGN